MLPEKSPFQGDGVTDLCRCHTTPGNWVSCGTCHDQRLIRSVSRVAPLRFVQGELLTPEELSELEAA